MTVLTDPIASVLQKSADPVELWKHISPYMAGLQPKPAQLRICSFMHRNKGLLVWHGTGTGKTLAALICAVDFLRRRKRNRVVVICEPSIIESGWKRSINTYITCTSAPDCPDVEALKERISVMTINSFEKYVRNLTFVQPENRTLMLIVDEAHQYKGRPVTRHASLKPKIMRTLVPTDMELSPGVKVHNSLSIREACITSVAKVLFLTATPIVNGVEDLRNIFQNITIVYKPDKAYLTDTTLPEIPLDADRLEESIKALSNMYDYATDIKNPAEWPDFQTWHMYLSPGAARYVQTAIKAVEGKKSVAHSAVRLVSVLTSAVDKKKIQDLRLLTKDKDLATLLDEARKIGIHESGKVEFLLGMSPARRCEVFDHDSKQITPPAVNPLSCPPDLETKNSVVFIDMGIEQISSILPLILEKRYPKLKDRISIITGATSGKKRGEILARFNTPREKGENGKMIIISKAGNTGLELKAVHYVFVLDASWTHAVFLQTIGRSIRTGSHVSPTGCQSDDDCGRFEDFRFCSEALKKCAVRDPMVRVYVLLTENDQPQKIAFADLREKELRARKEEVMKRAALLAAKHARTDVLTKRVSTMIQSPDLPPEFRRWIGDAFELNDQTLDVYQLYTIYVSGSVQSIFPHSANSIVNVVYNRVNSRVVERFLNLLHTSTKGQIRYIHIKHSESTKKTTTSSYPDLKQRPLTESDKVCVYVELEQKGGFGHFGGFFYDGTTDKNIVRFYDSMLAGKTGPYVDTFSGMLRAIPFFRAKTIDVDYEDAFYSMEDTGGQNNVANSALGVAPARWLLSSILLGPDAQNQYCYMWAIMYLICTTLHHIDASLFCSWKTLCSRIVSNNMIPLVVVKSFIIIMSNLSEFKVFKPLWDNEFVKKWYPYFTSNATTYSELFNPDNNDWKMYKIGLGKRSKSTTLKSCWNEFVALVAGNKLVLTPHVLPPPTGIYQDVIFDSARDKLGSLPGTTLMEPKKVIETFLSKNSRVQLTLDEYQRALQTRLHKTGATSATTKARKRRVASNSDASNKRKKAV